MTESPLEPLRRQWRDALQAFETEADESSLLQPLHDLAHATQTDLPEALRSIRDRGYVFGPELEQKLSELSRRFTLAEDEIRREAESRLRDLHWRRDDLVRHARELEVATTRAADTDDQANPTAEAQIHGLIDEVAALRREVPRIKQTLQTRIGEVTPFVQTLRQRVAAIDETLRRGGEASFAFRGDEALLVSVAAEWRKGPTGRDGIDGVLHVTDARLIMEQRQKEGGFLGFGGHQVRQLAWEIPWSEVETLAAEERGLFGGVDLVHIQRKGEAAEARTTVEIKGGIDAHPFVAQIRPALEGNLVRVKRVR